MAGHWGYRPVFAAAAAAALLPMVSVPTLPGHLTPGQHAFRVLAGLRNVRLMRLALVFAASTVAAGVLVTFLPLAVTTATATATLFVLAAAATAARWAAGRVGDRCGQTRLLGPGMLLSTAGMALLAAVHLPAAVVCGAASFGAGFGIVQNATLALMYPPSSSSPRWRPACCGERLRRSGDRALQHADCTSTPVGNPSPPGVPGTDQGTAGRPKLVEDFSLPVSIPGPPVRSSSESGRVPWPPAFQGDAMRKIVAA